MKQRYSYSDLEALRGFLDLPTSPKARSNPSEVVFVSIDFENGSGITSHPESKNVSCQAGISILDSKDITSFGHDATQTTHSLASCHSLSSRWFIDRRFLFGQIEFIDSLTYDAPLNNSSIEAA